VAHEINGPQQAELRSRSQVTSEFIPTLSAQRREVFKSRLATAVGVHIKDLARQAALYLSPGQLAHTWIFGFEMATTPFLTSIVRCLSGLDFSNEICQNKSTLEASVG